MRIGSVVGNSFHLNRVSANIDGKLFPAVGGGDTFQTPLFPILPLLSAHRPAHSSAHRSAQLSLTVCEFNRAEPQ